MDENLWMEKQQNGFHVINTRFNKNEIEKGFIVILDKTIQELSNHRQNNFTGQILMHHTLQSTKFMSKWIEAKNK